MIYGIDFGTSNTVVAYGDIRKSRVLQFGNSSIIPSLMYVDYSGKISIGRNAIADYARGLQLYGNKSDPYAYFRFFQGLKMVLRDNDLDQITLFDKPTRVEDLIGMFLRCLREEIETLTHDSSDEVVIGWPADLDEKANEVVMRRFISGCEYAGYKTIHFVHEPVAVLIDSLQELNGTCMIFDFGGGTLDLTVADVRDNHVDIRAIIGKRLGGYTLSEDIAKQRIIKFFGHGSEYQNYGRPKLILPYHLTSQVASFNTLPLKAIAEVKRTIARFISTACDKNAIRALYEFVNKGLSHSLYQEIDRAKIELSNTKESTISFTVEPYISFEENLTRDDFETIIQSRLQEISLLIQQVLITAKVEPSDIDCIFMVGGSTQIPAVQKLLQAAFPGQIREGDIFSSIASGLIDAHFKGFGIR